ncbi:cyclic nucleotide-binding domain-containing protein [Lachnospiraceae bacterium 54-53]
MEHQCDCCSNLCTSRISLFQPLSSEEQRDLILNARHLNYQKGETVFHEYDRADKILVIRYGKIKFNHYSPEGKEYVLDIPGEGDIYGEQNIFEGKVFEANAIALGESGVCLISPGDIQSLILKRPEIRN